MFDHPSNHPQGMHGLILKQTIHALLLQEKQNTPSSPSASSCEGPTATTTILDCPL